MTTTSKHVAFSSVLLSIVICTKHEATYVPENEVSFLRDYWIFIFEDHFSFCKADSHVELPTKNEIEFPETVPTVEGGWLVEY